MRRETETTSKRSLRLWPGVLLAALVLLLRYGLPRIVPGSDVMLFAVLGGLLGALAIVAWWVFFSRGPRIERWGALVGIVVGIALTPRLLHESVAEGNMGFQFYLHAIPVVPLALVAWAVTCHRLAVGPRRAALVATILVACGAFTLLRSRGITGDGMPEFTWRWTQTAEERLLAHFGTDGVPEPEPVSAAAETGAVWPGFRGPGRDGVVSGTRVETNWSASPPVELWRRPIGPGVSSFAVRGDLLYTQEQRGEEEIVACYHARTGEPVWMYRDTTRFWDAHVGAGPRATPAVGDGRVYTLGATGILNALDAGDGSLVWSRDAAADTRAKLPTWGFVGSPLLVGDLVVVHAGRLVAYGAATGEPRWRGPEGAGSYSSPQLLTLDGVPQVVLLSHAGALSVAPENGERLWEHEWPGIGIMQPTVTAEGDVLVSMVDGGAQPIGTRRLAVTHGPDGWTVEERWTSIGLKPSFSPVVVHRGHAYGFDGRILACIDLADGERRWKGGRYGSGQLVLLPAQDLLLVVSEQGELALVGATPDGFDELARFPAIEGKTWNQPAVIGDLLLVRNGLEMAAFRLPAASG